MKREAFDPQALKLPLTFFGVVLVFSLALLWYTDARQAETAQALQSQKTQLAQARQRYFASGMEREVIVKYLPLYQQLIQQGLIGEERRIEWIQHVRAVNEQYKLFGISYSIGTQENYTPLVPLNPGSFTLHHSVIKLKTPLLHEGDLLTMLDATFSGQFGAFVVRDCVLKRLPVQEKNKFIPYLDSSCEVDMVTITEPPHAEAKS